MNEPGKVCLLFLLRTQKAGTLVGMHCSFFSLATFNTLKKNKKSVLSDKTAAVVCVWWGKNREQFVQEMAELFYLSMWEKKGNSREERRQSFSSFSSNAPFWVSFIIYCPNVLSAIRIQRGNECRQASLVLPAHTHTCSYVMWWMVRDSLLPSTPTQLSYFLTVEEWNKPPHLLCCSIKKGQGFYSPGCLCGM